MRSETHGLYVKRKTVKHMPELDVHYSLCRMYKYAVTFGHNRYAKWMPRVERVLPRFLLFEVAYYKVKFSSFSYIPLLSSIRLNFPDLHP